MKYRFIDTHQHLWSVDGLCTVLQVSRSAYYRWRQVGPSMREQRNQALLPLVEEIHRQSRRTYGSPRIWQALSQQGIRCGRHRIARLMRLYGIRAKTKRRFKVTTRSGHTQTTVPDLVQRDFHAQGPNQLWTSDITYVWTREGWAYLAVVLDLYSRMIVGWELSARLTASLVTSAVDRALAWRTPSEGLVLHSDRGSQYASNELLELSKEHGIRLSMSRTGNCYDNAVTESFFHTFKTEHVFFSRFETRQDARTSIFDYIEVFYNRQRMHSTIRNLSPMQYEQQLNHP
ncbi:MAG TPA: IS3 family transposase [Bacteroidota bacterium]|nr:IS3 family transposase [Bacteroidota bacterium]